MTLEAFESTAVALAHAAGERALAAFQTTVALEFKGKKQNDPVTALDRDTETFFQQARGLLGGDGLLHAQGGNKILQLLIVVVDRQGPGLGVGQAVGRARPVAAIEWGSVVMVLS